MVAIAEHFDERVESGWSAAARYSRPGVSRQAAHAWFARLLGPLAAKKLIRKMTVGKLWSLLCARAAHDSGEKREVCQQIYRYLSSLDAHEVERCFRHDRTYLFIADGLLLPRMCKLEEVTTEEVIELQREAESAGLPVRVTRMNVGPILLQLLDRVTKEKR